MAENEKIGFFEQFYISIVKRKDYTKLSKLKGGRHFIYLLGITFLLVLIVYVIPLAGLLARIGGFSNFFLTRLPAFKIVDGEFSIETPMDFTVNSLHIVADSSVDTYSTLVVSEDKLPSVYFGKKGMTSNMGIVPMTFTYTMLGINNIDNQTVAASSGGFYMLLTFSGLIEWFALMGSYVFMALVFALFSIPVNKMVKANLSFGKLFALSLYAETVFALVSRIAMYFSGNMVFLIISAVSIIISMRSLNVAIMYHSPNPPRSPFDDMNE